MSISRHGGRGSVVVPAAVAVAVLGLTGGRAAAAPATPTTATPQCTLSKGDTPQCVAVDAQLDRALVDGGTAHLSIRLDAQVSLSSAEVQAILPANLSWVSPPRGFTVSRQASVAPESGGRTETASATLSLRPGHRITVAGTVKAAAAGDSTVTVRVSGRAGHPEEAATATVLATVGADRADSYLGYRPGPVGSAPTPANAAVRPSTAMAPKLLTPHNLPQPKQSGGVHPDAVACATGSWTYQDQNGAFHPQVNVQVQLWAKGFLADDMLAMGLTDQNGGYRLCAPNAAHNDIWVQEVTDNGKWTVQNNSGDPYTVTTPTVNNVGNGSTTDFGSRFPSNTQFMRAMHAFDEANDASTWTPGDCWSPNDHDCKTLHIQWTPNSTDGAYYRPDQDRVHLRAENPDTRSVVVHELGHGVMDNAYHDNFPAAEPSCQTHFINRSNGKVCAWTEGFADWYQAAVYNSPVYDFGGGNVLNLEDPTWGTPDFDNGDTVEGRVAGAMIDLTDSANEPYWDRHSEANPGPLMQTLFNHRATTFSQFWAERGQDNFDVGPDALAALYQNTIDYQFRDPLAPYMPLTRPAPVGTNHNYQFRTTTVFWSVVALRPQTGDDYDLYLYDDAAQAHQVGASTLGPGTVDFVAVDSNRRPLGDYFPQVRNVAGSKEYRIELAQGASQLQNSEQIAMGAGDVATVRDACLNSGDKITLTATPSDPGQYGELFVMADDPANNATWVQARASAAATSPDHQPGQPATTSFTAPNAGCFGVVLVNKAGSGTYTLNRS